MQIVGHNSEGGAVIILITDIKIVNLCWLSDEVLYSQIVFNRYQSGVFNSMNKLYGQQQSD